MEKEKEESRVNSLFMFDGDLKWIYFNGITLLIYVQTFFKAAVIQNS